MRRSLALMLALAAPSAAMAQTSQPAEQPSGTAETNAPATASEDAPADRAAEAAPAQRPDPAPPEPATVRPTPPPPDLLDRVGQAFSLHGYLRVRPEMMHNFALGWDRPELVLGRSFNYQESGWPWVRNPDNGVANLCSSAPPPGSSVRTPGDCFNNYQTMANMRLRLQPEIHVSDSIAVYAQVDVFDNLILGSTPQGYYNGGGANASPWAPLTAMSPTQVTPTERNSLVPAITVSRAWAEVTNPTLGQIRFGRMPWHWGLGIFSNQGNGVDSDYQTHVDRIMYQFRLRSLGLFAAAMYDFASTGLTSAAYRYEQGQGQPIDLSTLDDVNQYGLAVGRRVDAAEARQRIARGDVVWNGGVYGLLRRQTLSYEGVGVPTAMNPGDMRVAGTTVPTADQQTGAVYRGATLGTVDLWFQLLHRNFRLELEAVANFGSLNVGTTAGDTVGRPLDVFQYAGALEFEYRLLNNRLQLEFRTGYASGDADLEGLNYNNSRTGVRPVRNGAQANTLFTFHPDYRVDLILWRQVFRQVSGAYYFRPGVMYAFVDRPGGDRFYGRASAIWSRASEFVQTRGNAADLGIELDAELTYISNWRDQTFGDRASPGFYASLQYGILFPMAGLGPTQTERGGSGPLGNFEFSNAQTLRAVLGVLF